MLLAVIIERNKIDGINLNVRFEFNLFSVFFMKNYLGNFNVENKNIYDMHVPAADDEPPFFGRFDLRFRFIATKNKRK